MATRSIGNGTGSTGPGTVSTVATTAVVGVLTTFTSTFTLPATISISGTVYDIASITDDTHLTTVQTQGTHAAVAYLVGLRNYSTIGVYSSYLNALALSAPEVGQLYNDSQFSFGSTAVTLGGYTGSSGTNTVTISPASGQGFADNANAQTNALRYNSANGVSITANIPYSAAFSVTGSNLTISGLQVTNTSGSSQGVMVCNGSNVNLTIQKNILQGPVRAGSDIFFLFGGSGTRNNILDNVIILTSTVGSGLSANDPSSAINVTGNTVLASNASGSTGTGIQSGYGSTLAINNVVYGFTTDYSGTGFTGTTNNATNKATIGGTGFGTNAVTSITSSAFQSVTASSEDLRLKSGSPLLDVGATAGPTTDIVGTSRPQGSAYDIGCWELVTGGATFQPVWTIPCNTAITGYAS